MSELNREQIKQTLKIYADTISPSRCAVCSWAEILKGLCEPLLFEHTISLIEKQDEQIFQLENRLKECENGYEGTLHLERCKLHDAEQKVKDLTEQNEKIGIENFNLVCELSRIKEDSVRKMQEEARQRCFMVGEEEFVALYDLDQIAKEILENN